jgi:hypothetical protein
MIVHVVLSFLCISDTVDDSDGWRRGYLTSTIPIFVGSQFYDLSQNFLSHQLYMTGVFSIFDAFKLPLAFHKYHM